MLYSKATVGGGAIVKSTSSGGGITRTTSAGGGTHRSTHSGGGSTQTSGISTGWPTNLYYFASSGPFTAIFNEENYKNHQHVINFSSDDLEHRHTVNIPVHSHEFSIPNHTHEVTIPNHTHEIELPNHTHNVKHEIVELDTLPTKVTIKVDGNVVPYTDINGDRINLIPYLAKDSDGRILRGRHEVEILPNGLARIEADLILRVFIQSQLGGVY